MKPPPDPARWRAVIADQTAVEQMLSGLPDVTIANLNRRARR